MVASETKKVVFFGQTACHLISYSIERLHASLCHGHEMA